MTFWSYFHDYDRPFGNPPLGKADMTARNATIDRRTNETETSVTLKLDGTGSSDVQTGIDFLDHLLNALGCHGRFDLKLRCKGDLQVDDHHTAEDCGLALGNALQEALGDRVGIARFGYAYALLDEALARAVVDISGRPFARIDLALTRERLGELSCENIPHVLSSLATAAGITLHVDVLEGDNDHHKAEAAFKAVALALRAAVGASGFDDIPSTKGTIGGVSP
jgi:imidazoleglycerol-phosphate dehydratase